jgi:hypothetical protein
LKLASAYQVKHLRPNSLDPNYSVVLANSFKKELAKDFYYEWKASTSKQRFINKKAANFVKKVVPEMRHKFRHYMKNHNPNYTFTYQPDFIDASNEEILNFLAEYTAYMDFIVQLEQELEQGNKEIDAEKNMPYNYSKLALFFHFYLKSIGIDTETMLKSSVARFIHLLFCIPYTDLKKTKTIYDKLRAAPLVTKDDTLVEYLSEVKNQFQKYDLNDAASLIDVYLTESIKEKNKKN